MNDEANRRAGEAFARAMNELARNGLSEEEATRRAKELGKLQPRHTGFLSPNAKGPHLPHLK